MNMSASVVLTNLPRDATQALADVGIIDSGKGSSSLSTIWLMTNSPSHRPLPAAALSPDFEESGLQSERFTEIRNCGQVPAQEVGL